MQCRLAVPNPTYSGDRTIGKKYPSCLEGRCGAKQGRVAQDVQPSGRDPIVSFAVDQILQGHDSRMPRAKTAVKFAVFFSY